MRLNFRSEYEKAVRSGKKTCTIRVWTPQYARRYRAGQRVDLAFGRRDRPRLVPGIIEEVEKLDMGPAVELVKRVRAAEKEEEVDQIMAKLGDQILDVIDDLVEPLLASGVPDDDDEIADAIFAIAEDLADAPDREAYAVWFRVDKPD